MHMLKDLHIVGWPLLIGILAEATGLRACMLPTLAPGGDAAAAMRRLTWTSQTGLCVLHACLVAIAAYASLALLRPAYPEWVEAGVATIAKAWDGGGNIYPDTAAPGKYTVFPYGPVLFQVVGALYATFGTSDRAVKIGFIGLALLTYVLMFCALRRARMSVQASALSVESLAVAVGIMGTMVKADIMLILIAAASCAVVAFGRSQIRMGIGLAMLGGLAAAIKIHGVFYVLPAAIACLAVRPRHVFAKTAAAVVIAAAVAAAPFLVPGTSVANYIFILRTASHDGLLFGIFLSNIVFIAMCVAGVQLLVPPIARDAAYRRLMLSVLAAGVAVSVFAAKAEAGPHHLIPLLPYLCLPLARSLEERFDTRRAILFVLFLLAFQPITSVAGDIAKMLAHWGTGRALI
jgi:4-amino-4-deoxy-L-arabinose transferase-like glycosyltransferase